MKLNPTQYIVKTFGGVRPTARAIGRDPSAIIQWDRRGQIPTSARIDILKAAKKLRLDITSEDLDFGRSVRTR